MILKEEIYEICKNTINKFKKVDIDKLKEIDPLYSWIQTDPGKLKAKEIINQVKSLSLSVLNEKSIKGQKIKMKTIVFNSILTVTALMPIIMMPDPENNENIIYLPNDLSDNLKVNYIKWLIENDNLIKEMNISTEKNFKNAAIILQNYCVWKTIYWIFQNCLIKIGVTNITERSEFLLRDSNLHYLKIIPLIDKNGILDETLLDDELKAKDLKKSLDDHKFIYED